MIRLPLRPNIDGFTLLQSIPGDVGYVMYVTKDTSCVSDTMYMLVTYPGIVAFYGLRTSFSVLSLASLLSDLRFVGKH